jgi:hypothetical protein
MPNAPVPAAAIGLPISSLIRDPFVAKAFRRAEREDDTAPALMPAEPRKPLRGGALGWPAVDSSFNSPTWRLDQELADARP